MEREGKNFAHLLLRVEGAIGVGKRLVQKVPLSNKMNENRKMKNKIEWRTPEYQYHAKGKEWMVYLGLISGLLFLSGLWFKNYLFSLFIGLSFFAVTVYAFRKPKIIKVLIDRQGVKINNSLYQYENLSSFWIFYNPPIKELSLRSKKMTMPYLKIPLADQDPTKIRKFLIKYLPEKKHRESLTEEFARRLKF